MWIDVNDYEPEDLTYVLCTNVHMEHLDTYLCIYDAEREQFLYTSREENKRVPVLATHWMPDPVSMISNNKHAENHNGL